MSECPQVKIMRLEERIKEQAAEIARLREAAEEDRAEWLAEARRG
tara:strand:+ start:498 stop:632 length:135 start_codon:yes stop_codon:yes gene_type:complete